ncbi:MAG: DUF2062 domain-containing protein [Flammeovirgaceae bacterium]|nr:DUF2062 domain-containing protein [Flammeovirgaceae bacterium]
MVKKFWRRLIGYLKSGTTPEKLALAVALGVVVGILPVWGISTLLCFFLAPLLKINVAILQMVNYAVYPLQLALIYPFIKTGSYIFNINPLPYSSEQLINLFKIDFFFAISEVGFAVILGVGVWAILSFPLFIFILVSSRIVFKRIAQKRQREL